MHPPGTGRISKPFSKSSRSSDATGCSRLRPSWVVAVSAAVLLGGCSSGSTTHQAPDPGGSPSAAPLSPYDKAVLADEPAGYWAGRADLTGNGRDGDVSGEPGEARMPNGDSAPQYDGDGEYLAIPDAPEFSASHTGELTVEAWLRPDTLQFKNGEEHGDYVHWLGKGSPDNQEYAARMYSLDNQEDRPNRISGYAFNPVGDQGAGSNFQDKVRTGVWIDYALVINTVDRSPQFPTGYVKIYKNGRLRDKDSLDDYDIVPADGSAPLRVGTRDKASFFVGAIGKVAVYDRELSAAQLLHHYRLMVR